MVRSAYQRHGRTDGKKKPSSVGKLAPNFSLRTRRRRSRAQPSPAVASTKATSSAGASTEQGPDKLAAVFTHDKYDHQLRVEAGLELMRMKPRSGRRIGVSRLIDCLAQLSPEERKKLIDGMLPQIVSHMKAPPARGARRASPRRPTRRYAYKDAAMAMLTYDKAVLVSDEASRKQLTDALIEWSQHDFEHRLDNTTQMFGMEQMMRTIGAPAVKGLPALISENSKYDRIASLVAELGDQPTKEAAAAKLVELAKQTGSQAWIDKTKPVGRRSQPRLEDHAHPRAAAKAARPIPGGGADQDLRLHQEGRDAPGARLLPLGGERQGAKREATPGRAGRHRRHASTATTPATSKRCWRSPRPTTRPTACAISPSSASARCRAIRWCKSSTGSSIRTNGRCAGWRRGRCSACRAPTSWPSSCRHLPAGLAPGFALTEPLSYGGLIDKMTVKGPKPREAVMPFLKEGSLAARLTALGFFYATGKAADAKVLAPFEADRLPVPKTDDPEAKWQCEVPKADGKETETKDIKDVGEFVRFCVTPAMKAR